MCFLFTDTGGLRLQFGHSTILVQKGVQKSLQGTQEEAKVLGIKKSFESQHHRLWFTVLKWFHYFTGISFFPEGKACRISSPPPSFNFDSSRKTNSLRFLSTNRQEQKPGKKSPTLELMVCAHRRNSLSQKKQQIKTSFKSDAKSRNNFYLIWRK